MERKFIDTNIFLRFLTKDDPSKYDKCKELFKRAMEGKINLATSSLVVAELIWTLLSYYKVSKADVIEKVSIIVGTETIHIPEKRILLQMPLSFIAEKTLIILIPIMLSS